MQANPGGEVDPSDAVGRDELIRELWRILDKQSAIIVAERRMGKSTVVKKMRQECLPGRILLYRDVENVQSPLEFVERVYQDIEEQFSGLKKGNGLVRRMFEGMAGFELGGIVKFPDKAARDWKRILEAAVADLAQQRQDTLVIFVWDELPLMLQKISRAENPQTTMDLLDTLRSLRQSHPGIRMVFTGSIGLHHVTSDLKLAGHMNDATNDMCVFEVPELSEPHAAELARRLVQGEQLNADDIDATIATLIKQTNAIPFYIHHVIAAARSRGRSVSAAMVSEIVQNALVGPHNSWRLDHFRERLDSYYGPDRVNVVLKVLDDVAVADAPVTFDHILQRIAGSMSPEASSPFTSRIIKGDAEALRLLLQLLQRDHYLQQEKTTGCYHFRFHLIRRWWRLHRNLMP